LWLPFDFKKWYKYTFKKNMQKSLFFKLVFCWCPEGQWWKKQDPDLNLNLDPNSHPFVRSIDPRIRIQIHTKMSWIPNTGLQNLFFRIDSWVP
jgi:hypothetical protein